MKSKRTIISIVALGAILGSSLVVAAPPEANVNVVNTPDVNVVNTVDQAVPVFSIGSMSEEEPFQEQISTVTSGQFASGDFTLPAGKRLVIESVSAVATLSSGIVPRYLKLRTTVSGGEVEHAIPLALVGGESCCDFYSAALATKIYADAGTDVRVVLELSSPTNSWAENFVSVSGFLLPVD